VTGPLGRRRQANWRIFRMPLVIGGASLVGLVSALVGDGWYDALSWGLLGGVLILVCRQLLR
jgi:hypothetical protein